MKAYHRLNRLNLLNRAAAGSCLFYIGLGLLPCGRTAPASGPHDLPNGFTGEVGHILNTREGRETAATRRHVQFDCGDGVVYENDFTVQSSFQPGDKDAMPTQMADSAARYVAFPPRSPGPAFLRIERDTVLKQGIEGANSPSPNLQMLSLDDANTAFTTYACVQVDGTAIQGKIIKAKFRDGANIRADNIRIGKTRNEAGDEAAAQEATSEGVTIRDVALRAGGYAGLISESGEALGVFVLRSDIQMGAAWQPLALHLSLKDANMRFGYHFPLQFLAAGMRLRQTFLLARVHLEAQGGDGFAYIQRLFGLGGSKPAYSVTMEAGSVTEISYPLSLATREHAAIARLTQAKLPCDLPVQLAGLQENWTTVCATLPLSGPTVPAKPGLLPYRVLKAREGAVCAAIDLTQHAQRLFLGHPVVCDRSEVDIRLVAWNAKGVTVELHNPTAAPLTTTLRIHKRLGSGGLTVSVPANAALDVPLSWR